MGHENDPNANTYGVSTYVKHITCSPKSYHFQTEPAAKICMKREMIQQKQTRSALPFVDLTYPNKFNSWARPPRPIDHGRLLNELNLITRDNGDDYSGDIVLNNHNFGWLFYFGCVAPTNFYLSLQSFCPLTMLH